MAAPQSTVFISYRRNVSSYLALLMLTALRQYDCDVFVDVESIDSGRFERIILGEIAARAHFLVILEHGTLADCQKPEDWVRREIECAIASERNIVPILVDGFNFDEKSRLDLTGKLCELPHYNALPLYHPYFDAAMEKLRKRFLQPSVQEIIKPVLRQNKPVVQHTREQVVPPPAPAYLNRTDTIAVELPQFYTIGHVGAVDTMLFKDQVPRITFDFQEGIRPEQCTQVVFC